MARNWAIAIGINQYQFLQPLQYARQDAELVRDFLGQEAKFEQIYFFSDDSPDVKGESTRPHRANLLRVLRQMFETPFMQAGDNFWFFFSGHGMRHEERDYLMPADGDPENVEDTAISISFVTERLRGSGADNIVLILDACRNEGSRSGEGVGRQTAVTARQTGVISIFSCSPREYSYEVEALQQGAFTRALLEGLGIQGQCATVERLDQYLANRVLELNRQHGKPRQTPYIIAEPLTKSHLILMPQYATLSDIATLKTDAFRAQTEQDFDLAKQLWIRVLAASGGRDMDAVEALGKIAAGLEEIRGQKVLADLYREASQLHREKQWQSVIAVFERIHHLNRNYPDPRGLLQSALKQQNLLMLYRQGKRYINTEQWFEALRQFEEIQRLEPGYRDTEELIAWLQQEDVDHEPEQLTRDTRLAGMQWLPTLRTTISWIICVGVAWYILGMCARGSMSYDDAFKYFASLGFLGGAVDGVITGLASQQTNSHFRWRRVTISIIIGCMIGAVSWAIAGSSLLEGSTDNSIPIGLAIVGAIFCRVALWFVSQKLSRA